MIPVLVLQIVKGWKIQLFPCDVSWLLNSSAPVKEELAIPLPIRVISGPIWVVLAHQALKTVDPRVESSVAVKYAAVRFCICPLLGVRKKLI